MQRLDIKTNINEICLKQQASAGDLNGSFLSLYRPFVNALVCKQRCHLDTVIVQGITILTQSYTMVLL